MELEHASTMTLSYHMLLHLLKDSQDGSALTLPVSVVWEGLRRQCSRC